ncbi:hypothetical protein ABK040_003476 [Willaertia magna]
MGNQSSSLTISDEQITELVEEREANGNTLLISTNKINANGPNDFEIYLSGSSQRGALLTRKDYSKDIWPKYFKYTRENIPVPLNSDETIEFISCGVDHVVIVTNYSKCYLFGDYKSTSSTKKRVPEDKHYCFPLNFKMNDFTKYSRLPGKITHLVSGMYFTILTDNLNRVWYSGNTGTDHLRSDKCIYEFVQLKINNEKEFLEPNRITHCVSGDQYAVFCVNEQLLFTTEKECNGVWKGPISEISKVDWNDDKQYFVKEVACSMSFTVVLTKCGKLFMSKHWFKELSFVKLTGSNFQINHIVSSYYNIFLIRDDNVIFELTQSKTLRKYYTLKEVIHDHVYFCSSNNGYWLNYFCGNKCYTITHPSQQEIILTTGMSINSTKVSGSMCVIFCKKKQNFGKCLLENKNFIDINVLK